MQPVGRHSIGGVREPPWNDNVNDNDNYCVIDKPPWNDNDNVNDNDNYPQMRGSGFAKGLDDDTDL